jgi:hypothetical protein
MANIDRSKFQSDFKRLRYFKQSLQFKLETLKAYINKTSKEMVDRQNALDDELQNAIRDTYDEDEKQQIIDFFLDDNLRYFDEFPNYFYESAFIIIFSFYEANLATICKYTRLDLNPLNPEAIGALPTKSYVPGSYFFLTRVCELDLTPLNSTYEKLEYMRDLRNFIAHNDFDLKHVANESSYLQREKTIKSINDWLENSIGVDNLKKCNIQRSELITEGLQLIEDFLLFVIEQALTKCTKQVKT